MRKSVSLSKTIQEDSCLLLVRIGANRVHQAVVV